MGLTLTFEIELLSDYHVGAGHGLGGGVDSALLRDRDGAPVLRGTVVAGLLRDALWRLLQLDLMKDYRLCKASDRERKAPAYCGQESAEADVKGACPICRVFGSARLRKHWQFSSARPVTLEQTNREGTWKPGGVGGTITRRARISPRLRRAEDKKLFAEEEGDGRLRFRFDASTVSQGEAALDEAALLVAAARNLRELGRSRRRGRGECVVRLVEPSDLPGLTRNANQSLQDALLDRFQRHWLETRSVSTGTQPLPYVVIATEAQAAPVRLRLLARADEPLLIAERAEAGNQFETMGLISGATVRGALAQLAAARFDLDKDKTAYKDFREVFLRGRVNFPCLLPAYRLAGENWMPAIPAPANLMTCKTYPALHNAREEHPLVPVCDDEQASRCPQCDDALKPLKDFLILRDFNTPNFTANYKPPHRTEMHIAIEPRRGRVEPGMLFGYVALDAGQYFVGELTCASETDWARLQALTGLAEAQPFELRLGKATRRGYGRVTLWVERLTEEPDTWIMANREISKRARPAGLPDSDVMLTLLTDAIIVDQWGRARLGFEGEWLARELKLERESFDLRAHFATTRTVDGFNDHLGLPRWRDLALKAGSAATLRWKKQPPDWEQKLMDAEWRGIGLRRVEGFGRIAFNHPVYTQCAGLTEAPSLAKPLRLSSALGGHALKRERERQHDWQEQVDALNLQKYLRDKGTANERACTSFAALASWLYAQRDAPLDTLLSRLKKFGKPSDALIQVVGEGEYGERSKDTYFYQDGKPGREQIEKMLEMLRDDADKYPAPDIGIAMIAERIAAEVDEARQK